MVHAKGAWLFSASIAAVFLGSCGGSQVHPFPSGPYLFMLSGKTPDGMCKIATAAAPPARVRAPKTATLGVSVRGGAELTAQLTQVLRP